MNNNSGTPFWGKQKPLKHYFEQGVITFSVKNGELYCHVKKIDKLGNYPLYTAKVENKEQLDILLGAKTLEFKSHLV